MEIDGDELIANLNMAIRLENDLEELEAQIDKELQEDQKHGEWNEDINYIHARTWQISLSFIASCLRTRAPRRRRPYYV